MVDVFEREGGRGSGGRVGVVNLNRRFAPRPPDFDETAEKLKKFKGTKLGFVLIWICREMEFSWRERERESIVGVVKTRLVVKRRGAI